MSVYPEKIDMEVEMNVPDIEMNMKYKEEKPKENSVSNQPVVIFRNKLNSFAQKHSKVINYVILAICLILYFIYFGFAIKHSFTLAKPLIIITSIVVFLIFYTLIKNYFGSAIYSKCLIHIDRFFSRNLSWMKYVILPCILIAIIFYLAFSVVKELRQLQSFTGIVTFIFILYCFSISPANINWRPVIWGFLLQFILGILILRWEHGYNAINWLSDQITKFINYSMEGAAGVFGDPFLLLHPFVFVAMPMLIYIGAVMSVLYYYGLTQMAASKVGWLMQKTLGTTAVETMSVAGNIFLNGMDTMLMLRPYLHRLTKSEFHCFLVGNHSTVAGFAFGLFVLMGAPPQHLISAAVMSAPAAVAIAKISYPETEVSTTRTQADVRFEKGSETNVMEAAANGAGIAGKTVMAVVVNLIAFLGMLAFVNTTLEWLGDRVGIEKLSFQLICSYLLYPVSLLMGIDVGDAREVGSLLGFKVFTSEILAYQELGAAIDDKRINARSAAISTYALCGFSGLSNLAIAVGVWKAVCPSKAKDMTDQMMRAVVNANLACFMTACIAGILYNPEFTAPLQPPSLLGSLIGTILDIIPGYKDLMNLLG